MRKNGESCSCIYKETPSGGLVRYVHKRSGDDGVQPPPDTQFPQLHGASQRKALSPYVQCSWHSPEEDLVKAAGVIGAAAAPMEPAAAWDDWPAPFLVLLPPPPHCCWKQPLLPPPRPRWPP
jgi:hypothetical protein